MVIPTLVENIRKEFIKETKPHFGECFGYNKKSYNDYGIFNYDMSLEYEKLLGLDLITNK